MTQNRESVRIERRSSGALRLTMRTDDGLTFEATQSPLTQRVSIPGQYLHIKGPLEHTRPQKARYDLHDGIVCNWPYNRNTGRRERFNGAAWLLIDEAVRLIYGPADTEQFDGGQTDG